MKLETFIDHHMDKDVSDIIIVDHNGNEIILPGNQYDKVEMQEVNYIKNVRIKIKANKI